MAGCTEHRANKKWKTATDSGGKPRIANLLSAGWGGRIRTSVWRNQNPLPYHLATPHRGTHVHWPSFAVVLPLSGFSTYARPGELAGYPIARNAIATVTLVIRHRLPATETEETGNPPRHLLQGARARQGRVDDEWCSDALPIKRVSPSDRRRNSGSRGEGGDPESLATDCPSRYGTAPSGVRA